MLKVIVRFAIFHLFKPPYLEKQVNVYNALVPQRIWNLVVRVYCCFIYSSKECTHQTVCSFVRDPVTSLRSLCASSSSLIIEDRSTDYYSCSSSKCLSLLQYLMNAHLKCKVIVGLKWWNETGTYIHIYLYVFTYYAINSIVNFAILAFCQEYFWDFYVATNNILENSTINFVYFGKSAYLYSESSYN